MKVTSVTHMRSTYIVNVGYFERPASHRKPSYVNAELLRVQLSNRDFSTRLTPPTRARLQHATLNIATTYGMLAAVLQVLLCKLSGEPIVLVPLQDRVSFTCLGVMRER